jgi:hypothetical protein
VAAFAAMLRVDVERWDQTIEDLRAVACQAAHPRTRERFLALYEIAKGSNATRVAADTGRCDEAVMAWVHAYNAKGPDALIFRHTGGHPLFARESKPRSTRPSARPSRSRPRRP